MKLSDYKGISLDSYMAQILDLNKNLDLEDSSAKIPINLYLTEGMLKKFLTNVKSQIRGSLEYKMWRVWFTQTYGPGICCASGNVVNIEIHHHPLVLEDYVDLMFLYLYNRKISFTTSLISDLVLRLHYENIIGACFISETYHVRFHEMHDIVIPEGSVHGDFIGLLNHPIIGKLLTPDMISKINQYLPNFSNQNKELLSIIEDEKENV